LEGVLSTSNKRFFRFAAVDVTAGLTIRTVFGLRRRFVRSGCGGTRRGGISLQRKKQRSIAETAGDLHLAQYIMLRFVAIDI
jgi:hypothetical protein